MICALEMFFIRKKEENKKIGTTHLNVFSIGMFFGYRCQILKPKYKKTLHLN
jgi:hypothetical protein